MRLSAQRFGDARRYLLEKARPLDAVMFRFAFEEGGAEGVLAALSRYQNADGGFGNALEPDFRLPASSAMATSVALQYLSRLRAPEAEKVAAKALGYLEEALDVASLRWEPVPRAVGEHPRAPWWEYQNWRENRMNPGAELVGYLWEFPGVFPQALRDALTGRAFSLLAEHDDALEMHDLLCYLRLAERLPDATASPLYAMLDRHVAEAVVTSREQWREYGLQPLQVAPTPDARYHPLLKEAAQENLDFLLETQEDDGSWLPAWSWGRFPEEWEVAKAEWQGVLTLERLQVLHAYGRIGG